VELSVEWHCTSDVIPKVLGLREAKRDLGIVTQIIAHFSLNFRGVKKENLA